MAGVYIHIPFCRKACHYCNFHFSTSLALKNGFLNALLNEIKLRKDYLATQLISTVYLGGGTPSILEQEELETILQAIRREYRLQAAAEITLEANPDDINTDKLLAWKAAGVNRLSIGVQSFFEEDLNWMNRAHTADQSVMSLELAKQHFDNITIDLIYGTPGLTDDKWQQNVEKAISLQIPHLSCYALTVEPKTALHDMIRKRKLEDIDSDQQARQFLLLIDWLEAAGYQHYEISNFSLPGKKSVHNSSYWSGESYIGLGPSAHSFDGRGRQWNIANNALYIQSLQKNELNCEREELSQSQQLNEYIMTSLRTMEGMKAEYIAKKFGAESFQQVVSSAKKFLTQQLMIEQDGNFILTKKGKLYADGIAADLFVSK